MSGTLKHFLLYVGGSIAHNTSSCAQHVMNMVRQDYWLARAQVLLGRWQCSLVAVKVLKEECTQHVGSNELASLRREAEMLQALNFPNILRFYGACFTSKPVRCQFIITDDTLSALCCNHGHLVQ